ncbi:MAG: uracil-DNA glycosylase [Magnetococcus sp. DMHC-8]
MEQPRMRAAASAGGVEPVAHPSGWREAHGEAEADAESVWQATGYGREAWQATLAYWLESGVVFRSGSQLEFYVPPPQTRREMPVSRTVESSPSEWTPAVPTVPVAALVQPFALPVGERDAALPDALPVGERAAILADLAGQVGVCERCSLARTRTQAVFGVGAVDAAVVFVGEGPGAEEDMRGEPFVGAAGRLLDNMLRGVGLGRSQVFIANVVKCRPPGNRNPQVEEVTACQGYLFRQLEVIRPRVIFCLGKFALLCLTGHAGAVGQARGQSFFWRSIPVIASYHPAYYLRTPSRKRAAWEDLLRLIKLLQPVP